MQRLKKDITNDIINIQDTYLISTAKKYNKNKLINKLTRKIMSITKNIRRIGKTLFIFISLCSVSLDTSLTFPYLLSLINMTETHTGIITIDTMIPKGKDINVTNLYRFPVI